MKFTYVILVALALAACITPEITEPPRIILERPEPPQLEAVTFEPVPHEGGGVLLLPDEARKLAANIAALNLHITELNLYIDHYERITGAGLWEHGDG